MPIVRKITRAVYESWSPGFTGRKPEAYVRFQLRKTSKGPMRIELQLGRAVWYEAGRPERIVFGRRGGTLMIVPAGEGGRKLHVRPNASPTCWMPVNLQVTPGRYTASVSDGLIVIGEREPAR